MSEYSIVKKIPNGKLVRIKIAIDNDTISLIKITGDFFMHPENTIDFIEKNLVGKRINEIAEVITKELKEHNAILIGCTPNDVEEMIIRGLK